MKSGKHFICFALLAILIPGFLDGAQRLTRIADSGTTVLARNFPQGKVVVKIHAATLGKGCVNVCPTSASWARYVWWIKGGLKKAVVVQDMDIFVNGHSLSVPLSAFATLFDPGEASIRFERGSFVLRIDAGIGAADTYSALLYFNGNQVSQLKVYSALDPTRPTVVTHYYPGRIRH